MRESATNYLERIQFFNGQRLFATDLNELEAFHRNMRELHNRSLHQPGVGKGYAVTGNRGDREVLIGPGYAIDEAGQEIVHAATRLEPIPPVESEPDGSSVYYDLTVSYPDDSELEESQTRVGVCLPRGVVRLREETVFCWIRLVRNSEENLVARDEKLGLDIEFARKIRIARIEIKGCQLESLSVAQRRNARAATQPYPAAGKRPLITAAEVSEFVQGLRALKVSDFTPEELKTLLQQRIKTLIEMHTVDTREARFVTTPCYFGDLQGQISGKPGSQVLSTEAVEGHGAIVRVLDSQPNHFKTQVEMPKKLFSLLQTAVLAPALVLLNPPNEILTVTEPETPTEFPTDISGGLDIVWMGIE